jgi:transcription elongation factor GreA
MFRQNDSNWPAHETLERAHIPRREEGAADDLPVTAETHRALGREVDKLRSEKERDIPERLRAARENGDGSSNDEFFAIREEEMIIDARLARLEDILSRARIVGPAESAKTVALGSLILVKDLDSGKEIDYLIDSAHAAFSPGAVSIVSPVGAALIGRRRGERVTVDLPKGRQRNLQVLAIKPLPAK